MSHWLYKITLPDGKAKSGEVTGKTEAKARERLKVLYAFTALHSLRMKPASQVSVAKAPVQAKLVSPVAKVVPVKLNTKLEKLLYLQSNKCFFCGRELTKAEASIEHLLPKSKGGKNDDGNVVACCVTLNRTFGSMDLKEKVRVILEKAGNFTCPKA